ncbi:MAG: protoporphyrinogen oxidase [Bacteroidales bacterium]
MMKEIKKDVTIIGAGLTGLTLAYDLKKAGKTVAVIEKDSRPGGVIYTLNDDGFVLEAGPNTGVLSTPELVELFDDLKGLCELELANEEAEKRLIWKNGSWKALPSGLMSAVTTPLFSLKDKFRILGEPFRKRGTNPDECLADMVRRRLGKSYLEYAVDPFISGIYAGDPEKLITRFALPKLYNLEQNYGSFIRGAIKKKKEPKTELEKRATKKVFSVNGGLQNLIDALTKGISSENIFYSCQQTEIKNMDNGFLTKTQKAGEQLVIRSEKVITTIGSYALPDLFPSIEKRDWKDIQSMNYAGVAQVAMGFKNWKGIPIHAFGGLVPSKEGKDILGILFPSSIFNGRAPKEGALLSVFLGGIKKPYLVEMSDEQIIKIAKEEVEKTLQTKNEPDLIKVFKYPYAIPQYDNLTEPKLAAIKNIENKFPGLILAGNIRDGIGMADRVKQAKNIANQMIRGDNE